MGYSSQAAAGFGWQTVLKVAGNVLVLAKIMILSRLFDDPTAFGVFSLVAIALGLTESVTQTGVNVTILQSAKRTEYFLDTAWVIAIIRGLIISSLMVSLGFAMSWYYGQSDLWLLVGIAALVPAIKGFINPMIVAWQKELQFFQDTLFRFALLCCEVSLTILFVWMQQSVASWVLALVACAVVEVVLSHLVWKIRPRFVYTSTRGWEILSAAKSLGFSSFINYVLENADNLLIGKVVGTYGLGLYQSTYSLSHELNYEIAKSLHHGAFPVMTKVQDDVARLRKAFFKLLLTGVVIMCAVSAPLILAPDLIMKLVFSSKWAEAYALAPWLTLAGILQGISMLGYTLLLSRKKMGFMNLHLSLVCVAMIGLVWWWGSAYGLLGAVIAVVISRLIGLPLLGVGVAFSLFGKKK
jgi:lipopolysaccharide exporter